jgi:LysR family transcriptional regulator, transcriptional activator for dmlA
MNLPELDDLTFFEKVARSQSLTEAARDWGLSVSAVSKRLSSLEARLGLQLVRRSTRRLQLTDEGARYARGAADLLMQISDLEDSVLESTGAIRGRVAVHSTLGLGRLHAAPLIAEFTRLNPGIEVELQVSHLPLNIAGTPFDIGLQVGAMQDSRLRAKLLHRSRRLVCASPQYIEQHGSPRSVQDLDDHNCIVIRENGTDFALWRFGDDRNASAVRVNGTMSSNDGEIATQWCLEGQGLIMRSLWHVAPLLRDGRLVQVLADIPTPSADIHAVYAKSSATPRRISSLLDFLQAGMANRLGPSEHSPID